MVAPPNPNKIITHFLVLSKLPKWMYGRIANANKNPKTKPVKCAQLSIHGNSPSKNRKPMKRRTLVTSKHGRFNICILCIASTNKQASIPNCAPAGPT